MKQDLIKTLECFPLILTDIFIKPFSPIFCSSSSNISIKSISEMQLLVLIKAMQASLQITQFLSKASFSW